MKYITIIDTFYPSFSKQEKKVADYIKQEKENISYMSLQEIGKIINVSEATIVRFVRKIGYVGFTDFKLDIAKESIIENKINTENYIENISYNIKSMIDSTTSLLNQKDIDETIKLIEKAEKLYIFGLGASGAAAIEFHNRFIRYGKMSNYTVDNHFQMMYSTLATKKDLMVIISLSGETQELIYSMNLAKKRGCKIIAITNYILSPIAKLADIVLLTSAKETPLNGGSLISKISQLYIIDILSTGYAIKNKKQAEETKKDMAIAIANKNYK